MPNTVFLRLEGPLQSWGSRAQWSVRDTEPEPTKSGVIGLVGCALGHIEDGPIRRLAERTRMGVRCDRPGTLLTDYHTVGGGYIEPALLNAKGDPKVTSVTGRENPPHVEITERDYLCDASFLVALQSDDEGVILQIAQALKTPVWPYFLGRKCCPPSRPVFDGMGAFDSLEAALSAGRWSESQQVKPELVRSVIETSVYTPGAVRRRDQPISRQYRTFGPRYTIDRLILVNPEVEHVPI